MAEVETTAAATAGDEAAHGKKGSGKRKERAGESEKENASSNNKKRQTEKVECIYGNYHSYYGYRVGVTMEEDPRVGVFKREWFENRVCLDIGCNEGYVTIAVAAKFCCKTMLGLDIDSHLIFKARRNLRQECTASKGPVNDGLTDGSTEVSLSGAEMTERISFRTQNYVEYREFPQAYDTVMCLSVTKWIHLNWGDSGLLKFFTKIYNELRPDGILVLEPQPWDSYSKKRRVSETARKNFKECKLRPDDFPNILTEKIGFKSVEKISSELPNDKSGFRRPLFICRK